MLKGMFEKDWVEFIRKIQYNAELYWKYPKPFIEVDVPVKKAHDERPEIAEWVNQNCKKDVFAVRFSVDNNEIWRFFFQEKNKAAEFKLTWGGE